MQSQFVGALRRFSDTNFGHIQMLTPHQRPSFKLCSTCFKLKLPHHTTHIQRSTTELSPFAWIDVEHQEFHSNSGVVVDVLFSKKNDPEIPLTLRAGWEFALFLVVWSMSYFSLCSKLPGIFKQSGQSFKTLCKWAIRLPRIRKPEATRNLLNNVFLQVTWLLSITYFASA